MNDKKFAMIMDVLKFAIYFGGFVYLLTHTIK